MMTSGIAVKKIRLALMLSQKEFGELLNVATNTITVYETNRRRPTYSVRRRLLELAKQLKLEINLEDFNK